MNLLGENLFGYLCRSIFLLTHPLFNIIQRFGQVHGFIPFYDSAKSRSRNDE